jgi:hypothetical protein
MNGEDQFENRLRRQAQRSIPPEWREEILSAARVAVPNRPLVTSNVVSALRALLWPHPTAWACLASIWVMVLGLNFASREEPAPHSVARHAAPPSRQMRELLKQQQQLLAELVAPYEKPEADRTKPLAPRPRSDRQKSESAVQTNCIAGLGSAPSNLGEDWRPGGAGCFS